MWMFNNSKLLFFSISWIRCTLCYAVFVLYFPLITRGITECEQNMIIMFPPRISQDYWLFPERQQAYSINFSYREWTELLNMNDSQNVSVLKVQTILAVGEVGEREVIKMIITRWIIWTSLFAFVCVLQHVCFLLLCIHIHVRRAETQERTVPYSSLCHFLAATVKRGLCSVRLNCRGWDE